VLCRLRLHEEPALVSGQAASGEGAEFRRNCQGAGLYHFFSSVDLGRSYSCVPKWDRPLAALACAGMQGSCHQLLGSSCSPCSHIAYGELRRHHQVQFVSESVGTGRYTVFYIPKFSSSLLHGGGGEGGQGGAVCSAADAPIGKVRAVLLYSLGVSCLETFVGLACRQEGRKVVCQAGAPMGLCLRFSHVHQCYWEYQLPAV